MRNWNLKGMYTNVNACESFYNILYFITVVSGIIKRMKISTRNGMAIRKNIDQSSIARSRMVVQTRPEIGVCGHLKVK